MKKVVVVFLFSALIFRAGAQKITIQGRISDASDATSLPGAHVMVAGTYIGTFSSADGSFALSLKPVFPLDIIVSFMGYRSDTLHLTQWDGKTLDIRLEPAAVISNEIVIQSIRSGSHDAPTYSNLSPVQLKTINNGSDIPVLLDQLPSVTSGSDAGTGIGYTAFRLRGTDQNRINVTLNGVPYNDPESHGVFWVDVPDLASSAENIQVQRGVGLSTNGAASFGGSVNILTHSYRPDAFAEINLRGGSYNTRGTTLLFGTGLLKNHWIIDGRASLLHTDGYVDRARADLHSLMGNIAWYGKKSNVRLMVMHGRENTYQAWNGIPKDSLSTNRTYNPYTYENEIDFYDQNHFHLVMTHQHNRKWSSGATAFLTTGYGYYEQKKDDEAFSEYLLPDLIVGNDTISETDLIRRKLMENYFYGIVVSTHYDNLKKLTLDLGGTMSRYEGDHFGQVIWMQYAGESNINHEYYRCDGLKDDVSGYAKMRYSLNSKLSLLTDMQVRSIAFTIGGDEDTRRNLDISKRYLFANPKISLQYKRGKNTLYAYAGTAGREPNRYMMVDADSGNVPEPEFLIDYEAGFTHAADQWNVQMNLYYMDYRDQLVQTGEINDVGAAVYSNVSESYRAGIELIGGWNISRKIQWQGNLTLSRNKIKNLKVFVDDWDTWTQRSENYSSTDISFSPALIAASQLTLSPSRKFKFLITGKFVGRQYIDNTMSWERQLHPYSVADIHAEYHPQVRGLKEISFRLSLRNVFSTEYETNAWVYRYYSAGQHAVMDGYFPQAPLNWLGSVMVKF